MKTAVITGANGFIGSNLVGELLNNNYKVYALCHNKNSINIIKDERCVIISCELENISQLKELIPMGEAEVMFHFAWIGSAGNLRADTKVQLQNAQRTIDCLKVAKDIGCKKFLCAGTIMEHETIAAAYTQGNRPGPGYIYGSGKLVAHTMCMSIAAQIGIDLIWPEITNAYGVGERSARLINTTIQQCIRGESPRFTSGTQKYDFVYIDDVVRALRLISEKGKPFHEYLIGSGKARALREFLLEMKEAIAPHLDFVFGDIPFTGIDLPPEKFDTSHTEIDTGFKASVSFAEGCKRTFEWWKSVCDDV
ncbi:MAG: NAD(P)-dependent oxidoreductase [Lachnospiraceae bacterium]|nr:NAD(P)-dependent oxidoreductase [Lachnospiraceae bacterium]